jgi:hypothetical protein
MSLEPVSRGSPLLIHHCAWIGGVDAPSARIRLEEAVGSDLARLLLRALAEPRARPQGRRGSSSP